MRKRLVAEFEMFVFYYQIIVYDGMKTTRFNGWTDAHVKQGFSWREGCVSFGTLDTLPMSIEVWIDNEVRLRPDCSRAIRVPFVVAKRVQPRVAVVTEERPVAVPLGKYALVFQHGPEAQGDRMWCVFTFVWNGDPSPAVLIRDAELFPPSPLLMTAEPV